MHVPTAIRSVPPAALGFGAVFVGLVAFLSWDQSHWWTLRDDYLFGFFVPVFVLYVLWERRARLLDHFAPSAPPAAAAGRGGALDRFVGLALAVLAGLAVAGGVVFLLGGAAMRALEGPRLPASQMLAMGFAAWLLGGVYLFAGRRFDGSAAGWRERLALVPVFLFPALIWMLSAPMVDFLERRVSTFLLNKVAFVVFTGFDFFGYPLIRRESVLELPLGEVGVEDACSGIRSLTACLFAGSFLAAVFLDRWWKKVLLVGMSMVFAFLMNIARSVFLTAWAYAKGPESISGQVHDVTGYVVLGVTLVGLLALLPLFDYRLEEDEDDLVGPPGGQPPPEPST